MKSFAPKPWFAPQPVLIIGTYNKEGVANAMNAAWAGQWDMKEIMISMGNHVTTNNLKLGGEFTVAFATKKTMVASDLVGIVSAKNDPTAGMAEVHLLLGCACLLLSSCCSPSPRLNAAANPLASMI